MLWLWNQDPGARGAPLTGGMGPADFGYGGQYSKADLDNIFPLLKSTQDEAYAEAGLTGLRRAASHGTHVMDLLRGRSPGKSSSCNSPRRASTIHPGSG